MVHALISPHLGVPGEARLGSLLILLSREGIDCGATTTTCARLLPSLLPSSAPVLPSSFPFDRPIGREKASKHNHRNQSKCGSKETKTAKSKAKKHTCTFKSNKKDYCASSLAAVGAQLKQQSDTARCLFVLNSHEHVCVGAWKHACSCVYVHVRALCV